jgi:hypothetical protein
MDLTAAAAAAAAASASRPTTAQRCSMEMNAAAAAAAAAAVAATRSAAAARASIELDRRAAGRYSVDIDRRGSGRASIDMDRQPNAAGSDPVPVTSSTSGGVTGWAPKWAGTFWNPLAEVVRSGQIKNKGTGVFLPPGMSVNDDGDEEAAAKEGQVGEADAKGEQPQ